MFQSGPIMLGQYRPMDSFLHRLDARAKIVPITAVLVLSLFSTSFAFYLGTLFALISGLLVSGVSLGTLARNFRPMLLLALITVLYHLLFSNDDSRILVEYQGVYLTEGAVRKAGFFSLRLILFVSVAFLVTLTNSPSELAEAFVKLMRPLTWIRVPVQDLAMIIFIAIRFIPILYEEFHAIRRAQMIRGVSFNGGWLSRIRKSVVIIIPVLVVAIQRADDLALAIEARGYQSGPARTMYTRSRFGANEWLFMSLTLAALGLAFWGTRIYG